MYRVNSGPTAGLEQLLAYYKLAPVSFPPEITGAEEQIAYLNENTPLIAAPVTLDGAWYRSLSCPMVVWDQEDICHVVMPDRLGRAYYTSGESRRRVSLTGKTCGSFRRLGYAVQRDLPGEVPGLRAALARLWSGMGAFERAVLLFWSILGGGLLLLLSGLLQAMLKDVVQRPELPVALGYGAGLAGTALGLLGLLYVGRRMAERISRRAALGLLPALGVRLWFAHEPGDPALRAAGLAGLREAGEGLVRWELALLCGAGAGALPAAGLPAVSPGLALLAGGIAAVVLLAAAVRVWLSAGREGKTRANEEYRWLENRTGDKCFGVERAFPFGAENGAGSQIGLLWLALPALTAPVLFIAVRDGLSLARLAAVLVLYLPVVVLPLVVLAGADQAGRALAELRGLLRQAGRKSGHDRELPKQGSALELKNVTFTYPGRREPVLRDVDLRVFPGEILGIAGGTGAGKTTLARLMAGLLAPGTGQVYYGGIELGRYERESILRRIAFENGEDIRLLDHAPEEPDGRATVVFSAREEELACCERVFELSGGRLLPRVQGERGHRN